MSSAWLVPARRASSASRRNLSLWIAASPEVSLDPDATLLGQSSLCSFLQDSFMQVDDSEEEIKIKVVVPEVILKVFPVPWLVHKLDGPQFLSAS